MQYLPNRVIFIANILMISLYFDYILTTILEFLGHV